MIARTKYLGTAVGIRSVKIVIAFSVFAGLMWVVFFPRPYYWAIGFNALLLPLIVLYAFLGSTPFIFSSLGNPGGEEIDLAFVCVAICLGLILRTFADYQEVSDPSALGLFAAFCFGVALICWFFIRAVEIFMIAAICVLYFSPLAMQINGLGPASDAEIFKGVFLKKYTSTRGGGQNIAVVNGAERRDVKVGDRRYDEATFGDTLCIEDAVGRLGITTRSMVSCEGTGR